MRKLASNALIYGLGSVANQALAFILLPLYTNYLSPADYGTLAIVGASGAILHLVAALGIHAGLIRTFFDFDSEQDRSRVASTAFAFAVMTCAMLSTLLWSQAERLAPALFEVPESVVYWRFAVMTHTLWALMSVALATLQAHSRPRAYVAANLLGLVIQLATTIVLVAVLGRGVRGVLEGQLMGACVAVPAAVLPSLRGLRPILDRRLLRSMLTFSVPLVPTNLAAWGLSFADRYFLKEYSGYLDVGLYSLGLRLSSILEVMLIAPFAIAWSPFMFSIMKEPDHRETYAKTLEYFSFLACAVALGLGLFAGDLIRVMSDPSYWEADRVVFWLAIGFALRGMTFVTVAGIHVRRKTHYSAIVYLCGVAANLALLRWMVPGYGMMGAAFAKLATYGLITIGIWGVAQRLYPIPFRPAKIAAVLGVTVGLYATAQLLPAEQPLLSLLIKLLLLVALPPLLLLMRFFGSDDLERARRLVGGFFQRGDPSA